MLRCSDVRPRGPHWRQAVSRGRRAGLLLSCAVLVGFHFGCQSHSRHKHCARVIETVNAALDAIDADVKLAPHDRSAYERIANRYETLDRELAEFIKEAPPLATPLTSYRQVTVEAAGAARAAAAEDGSESSRKETSKLLRKARALEASSIRAIQSYCKGS